MAPRNGRASIRSFEELGQHFEEKGALTRAEEAFGAGESDEALRWLEKAKPSPEKAQLASKIHYNLAKHGHYAHRFGEALEHLDKCPRSAAVPNFLIEERARLLRDRSGSPVKKVEASTCDKCSGDDLWRVATCDCKSDPLPPAEKLDPTSLRPQVSQVYAAGAYRPGWDHKRGEAATSLMRRLKKDVDKPVLEQLGLVLASFLDYHTDLLRDVDAVVLIPSKGSRTVARGESIPRVIAETLSEELCLPLRFPLDARREPKDHSELSGNARREELSDAWEADEDPVLIGRNVLLVDDITTTGTTLQVAASLLKDAGIRNVYGAALQHTETSS